MKIFQIFNDYCCNSNADYFSKAEQVHPQYKKNRRLKLQKDGWLQALEI